MLKKIILKAELLTISKIYQTSFIDPTVYLISRTRLSFFFERTVISYNNNDLFCQYDVTSNKIIHNSYDVIYL